MEHEKKDRKGSGGRGGIADRRVGTSVLRIEIIHNLRNIHLPGCSRKRFANFRWLISVFLHKKKLPLSVESLAAPLRTKIYDVTIFVFCPQIALMCFR